MYLLDSQVLKKAVITALKTNRGVKLIKTFASFLRVMFLPLEVRMTVTAVVGDV